MWFKTSIVNFKTLTLWSDLSGSIQSSQLVIKGLILANNIFALWFISITHIFLANYRMMSKVCASQRGTCSPAISTEQSRYVFLAQTYSQLLLIFFYKMFLQKWSPYLKMVQEWKAHEDSPVYSIVADAKKMFTSSAAGEIKEWDQEDGSLRRTIIMMVIWSVFKKVHRSHKLINFRLIVF